MQNPACLKPSSDLRQTLWNTDRGNVGCHISFNTRFIYFLSGALGLHVIQLQQFIHYGLNLILGDV